MKWAKDWWFEMSEMDELDCEKLLRVLRGRFCTKLYGKVLIVQIMNKMGEGLVI